MQQLLNNCALRKNYVSTLNSIIFSPKFSTKGMNNPFDRLITKLEGTDKYFYDYKALQDSRINKLPFSIRILLESAIRNCDGLGTSQSDVEKILSWSPSQSVPQEIPFTPARVLLQDFTGVPAIVDLASMREYIATTGSDPKKINPLVPVDLVIDHSVQVDYSRSADSVIKNQEMEMYRNHERFKFLKWGANAFRNVRIVPPGSGIVHQINLEYLARCVFDNNGMLYPDSLVGTDSHTTMINGLGVLGWGVGGIEAEATMLGQSISMLLPDVVGFELTGAPSPNVFATDIVLAITSKLRSGLGVVGKFVEFWGDGLKHLSLADRTTISNMAPEYGATIGFFPIDSITLDYMKQTGRSTDNVDLIEKYVKSALLFCEGIESFSEIKYSINYKLNLSELKPSVAGPKRPHDNIILSQVKNDFQICLTSPLGFKGYALDKKSNPSKLELDGNTYELDHGSIVIAAITSCTNTSNPSVMIAAGLLAKNAYEKGLKVKPFVKTSLSPGSKTVNEYLQISGLTPYLEGLGFHVTGYGCMTCIGNSGDIDPRIAKVISENKLVAVSVLSGNRNFEGRIHPLTRANFLASPPLVVAYALAGKINIDFDTEPIGYSSDNKPVYLRDIMPRKEEISEIENKHIKADLFNSIYKNLSRGSTSWQSLDVPQSELYPWDPDSTYIKNPPFFDNVSYMKKIEPIRDASIFLWLGDSVTTDHISPAGNISKTSPAAKYLESRGISPRDFNSYGSRRGNDEIMRRGTFANIRLINQLCPSDGPKTVYHPSGEVMSVFDAAEKYNQSSTPLVIIAGKDYGSGSSRDWAAKGTALLGVKCIIAESFERIHRTNLVGMGILPLQYQSKTSLKNIICPSTEKLTIELPENIVPGQMIKITTSGGKYFQAKCRIDTALEVEYYKSGGILQYVLMNMSKHV
ncbi:aconitate hydratase 1 [Babesia microti strain RI]|uniref:Aconitate hydratase n=1 Tax=Babesia microti (strain RI) TaxID=1133968 RepID=A0A1N6LX79_BABMR|nr:aconitate hydratase 1 [Babesia microti strain RI]XP_021338846.1 aconitate hydratase 1 [Babesia microti strain RI]SIO73490.1 aconitate hydratase 1 [Babesia microti strain RI]SJK86723.1 aconitate hydratase 1 [Babesia microti strain RI]|eukprot:XP_021337586.1 aconitate hydratase 1 [Babesia microti strain RI]